MIYAQETVRVIPHKFDEYVHALESEQMPVYHDLGYRLVACWETVASQGYWPEVISLWEMDDYAAYGAICRKQYADDQAGRGFRAWRERLGDLVTQTQGRILLPSSKTPSLEEVRRAGLGAKVCVHETVVSTPRKSKEYAEQVQRLWEPVATRFGRWMVGVYAVAWRNTEAINIWALEDWEAIGKYQDVIMQDPEARGWSEIAISLRTDWHDRLLSALPFSPI